METVRTQAQPAYVLRFMHHEPFMFGAKQELHAVLRGFGKGCAAAVDVHYAEHEYKTRHLRFEFYLD